MISFDPNGNPPGTKTLEISLSQFQKIFVDRFANSATRRQIWKGYINYTADLSKEVGTDFKHWIGGGFASAEPDPSDIDIVVLLPHRDALDDKSYLLEQFTKIGGSREEYLVDASLIILYPEGDPRFQESLDKLIYWKILFALDRKDRPRSFFEIDFGVNSC